VVEDNDSVLGWRRQTCSRRDPEAADDIPFPDYVMLDFIDKSFASQTTEQHKAATEPQRHD